jgi:hypothetical protein
VQPAVPMHTYLSTRVATLPTEVRTRYPVTHRCPSSLKSPIKHAQQPCSPWRSPVPPSLLSRAPEDVEPFPRAALVSFTSWCFRAEQAAPDCPSPLKQQTGVCHVTDAMCSATGFMANQASAVQFVSHAVDVGVQSEYVCHAGMHEWQ